MGTPLTFNAVNDFGIAVGLGVIRNTNGNQYRPFSQHGNQRIVGIGGSDIWPTGGDIPFPEAASAVRIAAGGNAADDDGTSGTGAHKVVVYGLDENMELAQAEIATAGASASAPTSITFFRVFFAIVTEVGDYGGTNVASISIETTGSVHLLGIAAEDGESHHGALTVPAGYTYFLKSVTYTVESRKVISTRIYSRGAADSVALAIANQPVRERRVYSDLIGGTHRYVYESPIRIEEKTDLWAWAVAQATTASVGITYHGFLVPNK